MGQGHRLTRSQVIPRRRAEVFEFFADASNLERITPPFVGFKILTPRPILIHEGALIDYQLRFYGVPLRWKTRIETFEPGVAFSDVQISGPYRRWHHRHTFTDAPGGTRMEDVVDYELPLGPLGDLARVLFVAGSLERIFDYRAEQIRAMFGAARHPNAP